MKSVELLKFNDRQSLVQIFKDNGEHHQYCVCSYYDANKPEGSKWSWGHYFTTMEGALKYIATKCFSPMYKYVLVETDTSNNITEHTYDTYDEAREEFDKRFEGYSSDECCHHAEIVDDGNGNTVGELWFDNDDGCNDDIELKIIEVRV